MRKILLILVLFFAISCNIRNHRADNGNLYNSVVSNENLLFKIKVLNDTLDFFLKTIDAIPNPLEAHTINNIILFPDGNDTIIGFVAKLTLHTIYDDEKEYFFLKGGYKIGDRYIAVYYVHFAELDNIVNEEMLNKDIIGNILSEIPKDTLSSKWYYDAHEWSYKLNGNVLVALKKRTLTYEGLDYILP